MKTNKYYDQQKTTTEKWIIESTERFNSKFDYSKVEITNSDTKVTIICPIHGEFKMTKHNHVNSKHGCLQCVKDIQKQERLDNQQNKFEEFKDKINKKFNNNIEILECDYTIATKSPCISKCNVCSTETKWNSIQLLFDHQSGCKFCVQEKESLRNINRMLESTNKWKAECKAKFGDNFEYNFEYSGRDDLIEIICKQHGAFKTTREIHKDSPTGACSKCSPLTNVKSKDERKTLHLNRIFENIKNKNKNINIIGFQYNESNDVKLLTYCNNCQNYATYYQFNNFINSKVNCVRCYQNDRIEKSTKEFIKNASIKFKNKFDYSKSKSGLYSDKVVIICPEHGEFEMTKVGHLESIHGCNMCSNNVVTNDTFKYKIENKFPNMFNFDKINLKFKKLINAKYDITLYAYNNIIFNYIVPTNLIHKINIHRYLKYRYPNERIITIYSTNDFDKNISIMKNILQLNENKIYARNCELREITNSTSNIFLNKYHLQGARNASICLGLFYNDKLVQVMTFGKCSYFKQNEYNKYIELYRLASKSNLTVVGGASKLLKYFEKNLSKEYTHIVSYADSSFSEGNVYSKLGFEFSHDSGFGYFYVNDEYMLSRYQATKSKIAHYYKNKINNIKKFDESKTELINMEMNGYIKIIIPKQLCYIKKL